ncbi:cyclin-dependent kinase inhibitor 1-like [Rhinoraja longicauda]
MDESSSSACEQWRVLVGKRGPVRQSLFGPVDGRQVRAKFRAELRSGLEAAARRWAFDFEAERPLKGNLQWEAVPSQDVPSFYRPVRGSQQRRLLEPPGPGEAPRERSPSPEQKPNSPLSRKRKQALITDFYALKRRLGPLGPESKP